MKYFIDVQVHLNEDKYLQQFSTHINDVQKYLNMHTIKQTLEHFEAITHVGDDFYIYTEGYVWGDDPSEEMTHIQMGLWFKDPRTQKKLRGEKPRGLLRSMLMIMK